MPQAGSVSVCVYSVLKGELYSKRFKIIIACFDRVCGKPPFMALVLAAMAAGKLNDMTLLGAHLFFWSRLAYAVIYVIGVPYLRTTVWAVSAVGLVLIFLQLV